MKTLQEQYNLIQEGKGSKETFLKEAKAKFPNMVTNAATFEETAKILKNRSVISEALGGVVDLPAVTQFEGRQKEGYELAFQKFLAEEAKAVEKKVTKDVEEAEVAGYDYKSEKELDNQIGHEVQHGVYFEAKQNPDKSLEEIKEIVAKNLAKDQLYYKKNAMFGVEGLGLEEMKSDEVSGNHKSSGYSDKLKALVKESLGGVVTTGNPYSMSALQNEVINDMLQEKEEDKEEKEEKPAPKKAKKVKKETIDSKLAEIEAAGKVTTLEAQIAALEEVIAQKEERLSLVNEDSEMAELLDTKKVKMMQKEIKMLEKRCGKMKKTYEKLNGSAYTGPVVDEADAYTFDQQSGASHSPAPHKVGQTTVQ